MKEFRIRLSCNILSSLCFVESIDNEPPFLHSLYPQASSQAAMKN